MHEAQSDHLSGQNVQAFKLLYPHLSKLTDQGSTELLAAILADSAIDLERKKVEKALSHLLQLDESST